MQAVFRFHILIGHKLMYKKKNLYLTGHLLIAMPDMIDPRFTKSVIYICTHGPDGAMGLVINKPMGDITFHDLLKQLEIDIPKKDNFEVLNGGPVDSGRGFMLHSGDYAQDETLFISEQFALTATIDILKAVATGNGPKEQLLTLGYAGWGPGQLDLEMLNNGWLSVNADDKLVFEAPHSEKWADAINKIGIDPTILSDQAGHA